jgi:predicted amidohydrolase
MISSSERGATLDPCAINTGSVAVVVVDGGSCGCCCFLLLAQHLVRQTLSSSSKRTENERVSISSSIRKDLVEPSIVLHVKHPRLMVENVVNGIRVGRIVTAATKHCLLTRVMFQESRRPSTMQSKQCRHFQRRLISKPLTLNRTLEPFLPPLSSKICVTPRLLILGTRHA